MRMAGLEACPTSDVLTSIVKTSIVRDMKTSIQVHPETRRFDSLEQEAFLNLWRTYDRLKEHEERLFAKFDLSAQQYNALRLLQGVSPRTIPTLALGAKLISRAPDMTRLLDRLDQKGLVHRERRPGNRRVVEVGITEAGHQLLKDMADQVQECNEQQLGHLSREKLKQLVLLLREARKPHEETVAWNDEE